MPGLYCPFALRKAPFGEQVIGDYNSRLLSRLACGVSQRPRKYIECKFTLVMALRFWVAVLLFTSGGEMIFLTPLIFIK